MQRALCEQCSKPQPREWTAGGLCAHCGGVVRREVRCAWCAVFSPWPPSAPTAFCRECGAQLVAPDRYGAARMLKDAGVDRLSLAKRLEELDPGQRETFASIYAKQAAVAAARVDECRFVESFLLDPVYSAYLEDELVSALPATREAIAGLEAGPQPPFEGADSLRAIAESSPFRQTRALAQIARLIAGDVDDDAISSALSSARYGYGPIALEAALALVRPRVRGTRGSRVGARDIHRFCELAEPALADPKAGPWVAVLLALPLEAELRHKDWSGHEDAKRRLDELSDALRRGLASSDPDLRFACALALRDEAVLSTMVGSDDEILGRLAREAAASTQTTLAHQVFRDGPDEARLDALAALTHPVDEPTARAVMDGIRGGGETFRERGLRFFHASIRFEQHAPAVRALFAAFVKENATAFGARKTMEILAWAAAVPVERSASRHRPRDDAEVRPFLEAATEALVAASPASRGELLRELHGCWYPWIHAAGEPETALLSAWLQEPALMRPILDHVHYAHGQLSWDEPPDLRARNLLVERWARAGDAGRARLAPELAPVLRKAAQHREAYFAAFWERFKTLPGERDALLVALSSFDRELAEASARDGIALTGPDPARSFRAQWEPEKRRIYDLAIRATKGLTPAGSAPLIDAIADAAESMAGEADDLLTVFAVYQVLSRWAADAALAAPEGDEASAGALAQVERRFRALREKAISLHPPAKTTEEHYFNSKCEEVEKALAEPAARRAEARAEAEEKARHEAERVRREREQREAAEARERAAREAAAEAERRRAEAEAAVERRRKELEPVRSADGGYPIDVEVLLPEQPLKTLADYVGFMKRLGAGGNPVELMSRHGMDAQSYSQCAIAWGQLMSARTDVAIRFGQLMQSGSPRSD